MNNTPGFPGFPGFPGQPGGPGGPGQQPPPFTPGGPGQQPGQGQAPTSPPPSFIPQQPQQGPQLYAVDPGGISRCLFRYTYVWLNNREQFWFYPTFVGRNSVAGYRWFGFFWAYYGIDLRRINQFTCF